MSFVLSIVTSLSIGIAAIIAVFRFGNIHPVFRPFIYCIWIGLITEIVSIILAHAIRNSAVTSNIYVLLESLLITWQFCKWGLFGSNKIIFPLLLAVLVLTWFLENFVFFSIRQFSSWFRVFYSMVIVLMSISELNRQIVRERGMLLKNPEALICLSFIIYFTYKVLVETFWLYGLNESSTFQSKVYFILNYINLFSNLIYALAILWIPTKRRFTLPY
jgi:hypothetical protein